MHCQLDKSGWAAAKNLLKARSPPKARSAVKLIITTVATTVIIAIATLVYCITSIAYSPLRLMI